MTTIYWAGGEDSDMYQTGGGSVSTTSTYFRGTYSRCALLSPSIGSQVHWTNYLPFTASTFWTSARIGIQAQATVSGRKLLSWLDVSSLERVRISGTGTNDTYKVEKVDGAGSATQLGSSFLMPTSLLVAVDKIDVYMVYDASGTFTVYLNGIQYFTYSGDVTTNAITSLSYVRVGNPNNSNWGFSEIILADTDTRSWNLQTLAPVANGNTHDFDTGTPAAANVNEITLSDATLDGSTTAGQIDQYTIPAIAAGTYTIMAIGVSARMQKGASGPTKMDLGVRTAAADYWSADQVLTTSWTDYQNWWTTSPATSAVWAGLPTNIGLKSVT